MPVSAELVERSGDLKEALIRFGQARKFARHADIALDRYLQNERDADNAQLANAIDRFLLQYTLPDGRTVVETFVQEHLDLTPGERALLLGWRDVVEGLFRVDRHEGHAVLLTNLVDELTYRTHSNMGPEQLRKLLQGSFLMTRLVPIEDEWMLSGVAQIFPARLCQDIYLAAAELTLRSPSLAFRNPEKLARAWELQHEERRNFVEFFGTDLMVLPGSVVQERMQAFMQFHTNEVRDAHGQSAAERSQAQYGSAPPPVDFTLPANMTEADTVGVLYDEAEGMLFLRDFGLVEETFADPETVADDRHKNAVLEYLSDSSISPVVFRRLAERSAERASAVFARVLDRPDFSWDQDGEALLRQHKAEYFEQPPLPSVAPLSPQLSRAIRARRTPEATAPKRPTHSQPAQRRKRPSKGRSGRSR